MRRAISAITALLPVLWAVFFVSCPVVCVSDEVPPFPAGGVVRVMGKASMGHACAVSDDVLLTARHVVDAGSYWGGPLAWSDLGGSEGRAKPWRNDESRDISTLKITEGVPTVKFPIAKTAPKVGDSVYIVGYSMGTGNPLKANYVTAKVLGLSAGHLFYSKTPSFGSSGACVLNAQREVVAINVAMFSESGPGFGVAVYGRWAPDLTPDKTKELTI